MTKAEMKRDLLFLSKYTRSDEWPKVEKAFKRMNPECYVCGKSKNVIVHHIKPFWLFPSLELNQTNLMTLCPDHHLLIGHLMDWKSYNEHAKLNAKEWYIKIEGRPRWK